MIRKPVARLFPSLFPSSRLTSNRSYVNGTSRQFSHAGTGKNDWVPGRGDEALHSTQVDTTRGSEDQILRDGKSIQMTTQYAVKFDDTSSEISDERHATRKVDTLS
jgi:hypothetical protein